MNRSLLPLLLLLLGSVAAYSPSVACVCNSGGYLAPIQIVPFDAPIQPLFSVTCYLIGILAMFLIATPYRFRDLLEKIGHSRTCRTVSSLLCGLCGCVYLFVSLKL